VQLVGAVRLPAQRLHRAPHAELRCIANLALFVSSAGFWKGCV
jgi:hypothetical protein